MKTIQTLLIAAVTLLPQAKAGPPSPTDFVLGEGEIPVYYDPDGFVCFVNLPRAENDKLRHALSTCSAVRFRLDYSGSPVCILQRSEEQVAALLQELAAVPQWLDWRAGKDVDFEMAEPIEFSLLDADGKVMWSSDGNDLFFQILPNAAPVCILSRFAPMVPLVRRHYMPIIP